MAELVFKRYEKKYVMSSDTFEHLTARLMPMIVPDIYPEFSVTNIYMDTDDFLLATRSAANPTYREKLRLRVYAGSALRQTASQTMPGRASSQAAPIDPATPAFIELKKKLKGVTYKRRVEMTLAEAERFLVQGTLPEDITCLHASISSHGVSTFAPSPEQVLKEISYTIRHYGLKPRIITAYERRAYILECSPEIRLTFDFDLRCRAGDLSLTHGTYGTPLADPGTVIMEIKTPDTLPAFLTRILSEEGVYAGSFTKYGTAYRLYAAERSKKCLLIS